MISASPAFVRSRLTIAAYVMTGVFTLLLGFIGPLMPHLRAELSLTYAQAALHTSGFALGMMAAGLVGDRVARLTGRGAAIAIGIVGMAAGLTLMALAPIAAVSIAGCFVMGALGTLLLVVAPAILSEVHGEHGSLAFSEQNIVAYCGALFAPVLVWAFALSGQWRLVGVVGWVVLVLFALAFRGVAYPAPRAGVAATSTTLPLAYWGFWALLAFTVATEFSVLVWSASYLETVVGLSRETAVLSTAVFPTAMVLSRIVGAVLIRRVPIARLVLPSIAIGFVGFMLFWKAPVPALGLVGLFITGLGVANLYPCGIALAMASAGKATGAAAARASLGSGLAIILAPLTLGALADTVGIQLAYAAVPVLFALAVASFSLGRRAMLPPS